MSKNVHIISHSHWDREWYLPFEQHRMRLVELIDKCMEVFEKDDSFKSFFLDGQTIVLDDYLEIRLENKEKLIKYIKEGKFIIGPWYILQDEFYTSGEANIRNLLVGMKEAEKMLALSEPLPEHVEQVKRYGEDTKKKFPNYNVRTYVVYICANKGWKFWEV